MFSNVNKYRFQFKKPLKTKYDIFNYKKLLQIRGVFGM